MSEFVGSPELAISTWAGLLGMLKQWKCLNLGNDLEVLEKEPVGFCKGGCTPDSLSLPSIAGSGKWPVTVDTREQC